MSNDPLSSHARYEPFRRGIIKAWDFHDRPHVSPDITRPAKEIRMIPAANEIRHYGPEDSPSRRNPAIKSDARQFGPNRLQDMYASLPGTGGRA